MADVWDIQRPWRQIVWCLLPSPVTALVPLRAWDGDKFLEQPLRFNAIHCVVFYALKLGVVQNC